MTIYENKLMVHVFCPSNEASLTWTDLIVYSYLAYQDRYGKVPTTNRVAYLTGLSNGAVDEAKQRLGQLGLIVEGKPVARESWFWQKDSKGADHFSKRCAYWRCLVRADDSPLTATDTIVFSFLMDKKQSNFVPQRGWSYEYVATALCMTPKTVAACLDRLSKTEPRLFQRNGCHWGLPSCLVGSQPLWFKTRAKPAKVATFFEFDPSEPAPQTSVKESELANDNVMDENDWWFEVYSFIQEQGVPKHFVTDALRPIKSSVIFGSDNWKDVCIKGIEQWKKRKNVAGT